MDLADRIRRNATYLVDATSFEGRRRRARLSLRDRFEAARLFFESRIEQKNITLVDNIPPDIRTPPMFPSELSGIFTNLLSNAVKFSDVGGRIEVSAREHGGFCEVEVSTQAQPSIYLEHGVSSKRSSQLPSDLTLSWAKAWGWDSRSPAPSFKSMAAKSISSHHQPVLRRRYALEFR
ncbi:MAG: hypothetical protein WCE42_23330 [Rhizobium ruizarguesonis]|nr:ATP-binding protein [Rhizobium ruizarguesonis]